MIRAGTGRLAALEPVLAAVPGTVSVWCAPVAAHLPAYARLEHVPHYAASTMKLAVLVAAYRAHEAGRLDLDEPVPVVNRFRSALTGAPEFALSAGADADPEVWARLSGTASLRWLAERMIDTSSNLATDLVLAHLGIEPVAEVLRLVGAADSRICRGIDDAAARQAGITNEVSAADLAGLLSAIWAGTRPDRAPAGGSPDRLGAPPPGPATGPPPAGPDSCRAMLAILLEQRHREDLASGLPPGTRIAHKNGWVRGVRHGAALVFPPDTDPYALVVCATTPLAGRRDRHGYDEGCRLLATIAAASWADRHALGRAYPGA